jgi:PTS system ascorbate-specific IIA component
MTGILLVTHRPLGSALIQGVQHFAASVKEVMAHDIGAQDMPDRKIPAVLADIFQCGQAAGKSAGVLVLTDLVGATPANIAKRAVLAAQAQGIPCAILAGLNIPMLLRALAYRHLSLFETREKALEGGTQGVLYVA